MSLAACFCIILQQWYSPEVNCASRAYVSRWHWQSKAEVRWTSTANANYYIQLPNNAKRIISEFIYSTDLNEHYSLPTVLFCQNKCKRTNQAKLCS